MIRLHSGGHFKQVIAALKAALINGQAQPEHAVIPDGAAVLGEDFSLAVEAVGRQME